MKISKNVVIVSILALLLVVSLVQAVQLGNIKSNVGDISIGKSSSSGLSTSTSTETSSGSEGVPTNIQNLPGMVGGC